MLGKLMKYEWKATGKTLLPAYLVLMILTPIVCLIKNVDSFRSSLYGIISNLILFGWVMALLGVMLFTMIAIVYRFYKNLLTDEGYLMHTLPVTVDCHLASKTIVSIGWMIVSYLLVALATFSLFIGETDLIANIKAFLHFFSMSAKEELNISGGSLVLLLFLLMLAGTLLMIMLCYASLSLGQLFKKHKIASSIGFGVLFWVILEILYAYLLASTVHTNPLISFQPMLLIILGTSLVTSVLFYVLARILLKRKLNLE